MIQNPLDRDNTDELEQAMTWFGAGIEKGLALLQEDLESHDPYDPFNKPYSEKNVYFDRTNQYGGWLLTSGIYWVADIYYRRALDKILEYEKSTSKYFNKGIVYANLGITQIAQGKFDAGIAHLLTAEWEDRDVANPKEFILDTPLWQQFEHRVYAYFLSYNGKLGLTFTVDNSFLENLFKHIAPEERIFLQGTVLTLIDNLQQHNVQPNNFTHGRLFASLRDSCMLFESSLRKQQLAINSILPQTWADLDKLLKLALKAQNIGYPQQDLKNYNFANDTQNFLDNLEHISNNAKNVHLRWFHSIRLVRNFTGHHFDIAESVKSTKTGKTFFKDFYLKALEDVMSGFLFLVHIGEI